MRHIEEIYRDKIKEVESKYSSKKDRKRLIDELCKIIKLGVTNEDIVGDTISVYIEEKEEEI